MFDNNNEFDTELEKEWRSEIISKINQSDFFNTPQTKLPIKKWFKNNDGQCKVDVSWNDDKTILELLGFFGYIYLEYQNNKLIKVKEWK